ncbi:hypothetical protein EVAR_76132_1 [Eumeta japonica]|uniref:Uncharacterized protein n=1 Tax=Eumeta variegata TaxID=151549 RepID=A0A4C1UWD2_EUMVA|nr:hypothetical protein EVAR_76132_1 [Eumeta japonica]
MHSDVRIRKTNSENEYASRMYAARLIRLFAWRADKDDDRCTKRLRNLISNVELGSLPPYIYPWTLICDENSVVLNSASRSVLAKILRAKAVSIMERRALPNRRLRSQISDIHSCRGENKA